MVYAVLGLADEVCWHELSACRSSPTSRSISPLVPSLGTQLFAVGMALSASSIIWVNGQTWAAVVSPCSIVSLTLDSGITSRTIGVRTSKAPAELFDFIATFVRDVLRPPNDVVCKSQLSQI